MNRTLLLLSFLAAFCTRPCFAAFEVQVPAPSPAALADIPIQNAIDTVAASGGGVVLLGVGDFKLSRHAGDETLVLKSGVTLRGQGYATHLYLDPATPPNPARYYPVRIGTETSAASNIVVENLRYTGNNARIGGGSIMGFNARLGAPAARLLSCDNITVRNCWIYDAQQAAGCCKEGVFVYPTPERQATQFKNWQVCHNVIDTCGNKAVELAECNGGLIADNHITNAYDGPQVIFGSRNVQIRDNEVTFTETGINVSEGSNHIRVSGNHVEPVPGMKKNAKGGCLFFRTEPQALNSVISDIVVIGNIFRNQTTQDKTTLRFQTRKEAVTCTYQGITFTGNVFDGDLYFQDRTSPAHTTIADIVFADNICEGDIVSVPESIMVSRHVMVRGNMLRKPGACVLNASQWVWSGNTHASGTLQIAAGATGNVVHDNVTASPITDNGTGTHLANNVVFDKPAHQATRSFAPPKVVDFHEPAREYVERAAGGWQVWLERELAEQHQELAESALRRLDAKLNEWLRLLPPHTHARLQKLPIYLMLGEEAKAGGRNNGAEYFQAAAPRHNPQLDPRWSSALVIYSARNYVWLTDDWALRVLVHEFAHAWQLEQWPEQQPDILAAWQQAVAHKLYEGVKDVQGTRLEHAYAAHNQLEYFAELSCAYFFRGEYEPFDREALRHYDAPGFAMIEKMWGISEAPPQPAR